MVADVVMCDACGYQKYYCKCVKRMRPPEPPFMRIGDKGETVNPRTGERIPPPTTEWRRASKAVCTNCYLIVGMFLGSAITLLALAFR